VSPREIDFVPVQTLNFRLSQSGERANGEHRDNICLCALRALKQTPQFIHGEDFWWIVWQFWFGSVRNRIEVDYPPVRRVAE
jgi:hypothetical protein